jgi:hypothetical protein
MSTLTKEAILACSDVQYQEVEVPEWGGIVRLRSLTGDGREAYEVLAIQRSRGPKESDMDITGLRARLLSLTIVSDENELVFAEADVAALNKKSADVINRLFEIAATMNGLDVKAQEELEKN